MKDCETIERSPEAEARELSMTLRQQRLEVGLNTRGTKYKVKLSNVGNPDHRQDPRRNLPDTTCGWAHVETLRECAQMCGDYITFYDLGGGNWNGGEIVDDRGVVVGRVSYNGRVWDSNGKEINV